MSNRIIAAILLFSFGGVMSQYETMYMAQNPSNSVYDKTRQDLINNYLTNKQPLLNYVPVYNTDYGQWDSDGRKDSEDSSKTTPDVDFRKLGDVIARLKNDMQTLSDKTEHVYEDKLKELEEVKKLNENIKVALQNTDLLKNSFQENEKQLMELWKRNGGCGRAEGVDRFLKVVEGLDSVVRNINYKADKLETD